MSVAAPTVSGMDLREALELAGTLLREHGLDEWRVEVDRAKRRAGVCRYDRRVIGLSGPLTRLHPVAEVRETVLHEIAHALAGPQHAHDATWRVTAGQIGCRGERCVPLEAPSVPTAWVGTCPAGHTSGRHRAPDRVQSCRRCSASFSVDHLLEWTYNGCAVPMHPQYVEELHAIRSGRRLEVLAPGAPVQVVAAGRFAGVEGVVVSRGRTRYRVRTREGDLSVRFTGVRAGGGSAARRP